MKTTELKLSFLFILILSMMGTKTYAYDIAVKNADGKTIYYNYINEGKELEVIRDKYYSGVLVIPEEVTYMNRTRKVTSIGEGAFYKCNDLTSVTIGNNVTNIGEKAFMNCSRLTSVTIGNGVKSIGVNTFIGCNALTSVTIGNGVTNIDNYAFSDCDILEVISKIEDPFNIETNTFSNNTFFNATLYVPSGTIEKYKAKNGWKEFVYIEEGVPSGIEQPLSKTRQIQSEDGVLTIQDIKNGISVSVYNANGTFVGSTISQNERAIINTNMQPGSVVIVKIGEQSVKVIIK